MVLLVVVVLEVLVVVVVDAGDLPSPTLGRTLCLCLCLLGLVGLLALVLGSLGLVTLLPSLTSPRSESFCLPPSLSRLKISRRREGCLRGCSVSLMTGPGLVVVRAESGPNVGKNGVAVVVGLLGGSVATMLSEMVGRNTDEVSASKLTSSPSSEV